MAVNIAVRNVTRDKGESMMLDEVIKQCEQEIKLSGPSATLVLRKRRELMDSGKCFLCKEGPRGEILIELADGRDILVAFSAAEVKTYLEEKKHANVTDTSGN
jgi:hypothetical protein